jgi:hypothetical protein
MDQWGQSDDLNEYAGIIAVKIVHTAMLAIDAVS